jgi:hypothetical protein
VATLKSAASYASTYVRTSPYPPPNLGVNVRFALSDARDLPFRLREEFRTPQAYESLRRMNPRSVGDVLWGFRRLAVLCWVSAMVLAPSRIGV